MKVLCVVTAYPRSETDVITPWLVETVNRLRARGVETTVFTSSYRGLGDQTIFGTPVRRFRYFPRRWERLTHEETAVDRIKRGLLYKLMAVSYIICGTWSIWRLCRRERFDIIHVHWPVPHSLFGYVASRACKAPVVTSFYSAELMWVRNKLKLLKPFLGWAIDRADAVTAISTHTSRAINEVRQRPVSLVPFSAAVGQFPDAEPAVRRPGEKQLLFVGRLVERKGVPYLIQATEILAREMPVRLNIVGSGPDEPALRALVSERGLGSVVTLHGKVNAEELHRQYQNCDAFVLPAIIDAKGDTEGLGVVLIEAMGYRKPVVASCLGGITDIVRDEQTGLLVPPADPAALAAALRRVLTDKELADRLTAAADEHIHRNYSWPAIIGRIEGVYRSLLAEQG